MPLPSGVVGERGQIPSRSPAALWRRRSRIRLGWTQFSDVHHAFARSISDSEVLTIGLLDRAEEGVELPATSARSRELSPSKSERRSIAMAGARATPVRRLREELPARSEPRGLQLSVPLPWRVRGPR